MKDYLVTERWDVQPRYEITAQLECKDNRLASALIHVGLLKKAGDLEFCIIDSKPAVKFRIPNPTELTIYPRISEARYFLLQAINETQKVQKMMMAIQLADREADPG